jgi:long-chain acyl-CoA synthetase
MPELKIQSIFRALAANAENKIEYYDGGELRHSSYRQLHDDVIAVADHLESLGIGSGDRVGIWLENEYFWVALDLACLAIGAVSVPFHTTAEAFDVPAAILRFDLIALFGPTEVYLAGGASIRTLPRRALADLPRGAVHGRGLAAWDEDVAFTIQSTSGTTGRPKAMAVAVKSITAFLDTIRALFAFNKDDKIIIFLPLSHLGQRCYVYGAIAFGFDILLAPAAELFTAFRKGRPTLLVGVPHFFEKLHETFKAAQTGDQIRLFLGGRMRLMLTGSAPIRKDVLERFHRMGLTIYEGYGTTESGLITVNQPQAFRLGSVGRVIPNMEVRIGDDGEVLVRSQFSWADRYLGDPAASRAVFGRDGFIHTGDIGTFDSDGFLYLHGRIKEMLVLSNGNKAHPSDIESCLLNAGNDVVQACAFAQRDKVCAVVVAPEGVTLDRVDEQVARANRTLPRHLQIHRHIVAEEPFSFGNGLLTTNLKLNRPRILQMFLPRFSPMSLSAGEPRREASSGA